MDEALHAATPPGGQHGPAEAPGPPSRRRVMIVDDSPSVRAALRETLADMPAIGEIVEATDGLDALAQLARARVDLVVTDVTMPRLDGFKFLSAVRDNPRLRETLVIVLSAHGESVDKVRGLTIGANDYVTKPFERGELQARVTVMLKLQELREELTRKNEALERANRELERLASRDTLTDLPNRRAFFERLEIEFGRARRLGTPLTILMIDIDRFKGFNDRYGHQAGDLALRAVAGALQHGIRSYDVVGRYGGEEFIAFLPMTACRDAGLVAERLRSGVENLRILVPGPAEGAVPCSLTVSIGIACWPTNPAERLDDLLSAADRALYRAKGGGRNRCVYENPEPHRP